MDKTRERGSAQINIELKDGIITVRHTHPLGDILYTKDAKPGDWDKIWEAIKPTTFDVCSSHGTLTVNRNNGEVLHWNCNEELNHILKFDMVEYLTYHNLKDNSEVPDYVDILDIGYWYFNKGLKYEEPAHDWREEVKSRR